MSRLFISYSSQEKFEALAFREWLLKEGWSRSDIFLDLDAISAGEYWKEALAKANERCEAVVLLASPASLASTECLVEVRTAENFGKQILVAILHSLAPDCQELAIHRERQIVDLSQEPREAVFTVTHNGQQKTVGFHSSALARIKARLDQLGISPASFPWRPGDLTTASPYPGLKGFEVQDAALFFGRAGDIARGMAEIRKLRATAAGQILVIQAASGAGKSSFLKAGLWPRLARDPDFLPLAILRPSGGILTGDNGIGRQFSEFYAACGNGAHVTFTAAAIHEELRKPDEDACAFLASLISEATEAGHEMLRLTNPAAPPPTPLIAVDQAEELFAASDLEQSRRFLKLFASILQSSAFTVTPQLVWTLRADSTDALLRVAGEATLKAPALFALPPIPRDAYRDIIESPLTVSNQAGMKLSIDPMLVDVLIAKSAGADALPLLAFTLRQLLADNRAGSTANLTLRSFEAAGGIEGVLAARLTAAQRAGNGGPERLRRLFLPHLCTWDNGASPPGAKRLIAHEADLTAGPRADLEPLIEALVNERLLSRSGDEGHSVTLEVAHEALLRQPPISLWLEEDREFLIWRESVARARAGFEANARGLLIGRELEVARSWLEARDASDIPLGDRTFTEESVTADEAHRRGEEAKEREYRDAELRIAKAREEAANRVAKAARRVVQRTMAGLIAAVLLALVAGAAGFMAWKQQKDAEVQRQTAENQKLKTEELRRETQLTESGLLANAADQLMDDTLGKDAGTATLLALEALPDKASGIDRPILSDSVALLTRAMGLIREKTIFSLGSNNPALWSPDGKYILTWSEKSTFIWNPGDGKDIIRFDGHKDTISSAVWSPDGRHFVTTSSDKTARVWDLASRKEVSSLVGHTDVVNWATWSPDATKIATISEDLTVRIWDVATGRELVQLTGHCPLGRGPKFFGCHIGNVIWSPDSKIIITSDLSSNQKALYAWDAVTGNKLGHVDGIPGLEEGWIWGKNGPRILIHFTPSVIGVESFDAQGGMASIKLDGHCQPHQKYSIYFGVIHAVWSPDETRIATTAGDDTIRVWDAATGKQLVKLYSSNISDLAWSPEGAFLAAASRDRNSVTVWDAATWNEMDLLEGHCPSKKIPHKILDCIIAHVTWSPDGEFIATTSSDKTIRVWNMKSVQGSRTLPVKGHINGFSLSPNGKFLAIALLGTSSSVYDLATGKEVYFLQGHTGSVSSVAWSPSGSQIATASDDKTARIWDLGPLKNYESALGREVTRLEGHTAKLTDVAWSPDGKCIVTSSYDRTARVWDASTGEELGRLEGHDDIIWSVAWSPDGKNVATASNDKTARIWDATSYRELVKLSGSKGAVVSIAWSHDGSRIATGSEDPFSRIWEASTGRELVKLGSNSNDYASGVSWSPDDLDVITNYRNEDSISRIFEVLTGREIAKIETKLAGLLRKVEWRRNIPGSDVEAPIIAVSYRSVHVMHPLLTLQDRVDAAKNKMPRCLTTSQRKQYFLPPAPPIWCITGAGLEKGEDPAKWQPKWPYRSTAWRDWLIARKRGETLPMPTEE